MQLQVAKVASRAWGNAIDGSGIMAFDQSTGPQEYIMHSNFYSLCDFRASI